jgi:thiamine kinase-like enzyme
LGVISVLFLFLIVTAIGLLLPSKVIVSRAVDITASKDSIFKRVSNIQEWKAWVTGMNKEGVEIKSPTEANLLGTLVKITSTQNYMVTSQWKGKNGTTQESLIRIIQDSTSLKAVAQWQFTEQLKWYPWQRFGSMMNEAIMGTQLESNLSNLKKLCETR